MFTRNIVREIVRDVMAGTGLVQRLTQWRASVLAVYTTGVVLPDHLVRIYIFN